MVQGKSGEVEAPFWDTSSGKSSQNEGCAWRVQKIWSCKILRVMHPNISCVSDFDDEYFYGHAFIPLCISVFITTGSVPDFHPAHSWD